MKYVRLLLLGVYILAQASCSEAQLRTANGFEEYVAKGAGFKVNIPCKPHEDVSVEDAYKNGKQYSYTYRCSQGSTSLLISFIDHNPDTPAPIEKLFGYATGDYEFVPKKMTIQKSQDFSIGTFPARRYVVSGNNRIFYAVVATNEKGRLTLQMSFPDESIRSADSVKKDESMADEVIKSVAFLNK